MSVCEHVCGKKWLNLLVSIHEVKLTEEQEDVDVLENTGSLMRMDEKRGDWLLPWRRCVNDQ